jgi:hypothetical protein
MSPSCETKMDNYRSAKEPYYKEGNSTSRHFPMLYFFSSESVSLIDP